MQIISGRRGSGKTTELIQKCAKYKYALIVCPNEIQVVHVAVLAKNLGFTIQQPITFYDFIRGKFDKRKVEAFFFDNIDMSLMSLSKGIKIEAVSLSDERIKFRSPKYMTERSKKCRRE